MSSPLAYFLTWTTYGTWVHGDERTSVTDAVAAYDRRPLGRDDQLHALRLRMMTEPAFVMADGERAVVHKTVEDHAAHRGWRVFALNVRTNHVHFVVAASDTRAEIVAGQLKAWSTRRLKESGLCPGRTRFWTNQASTRKLWDEGALASACAYTRNQ